MVFRLCYNKGFPWLWQRLSSCLAARPLKSPRPSLNRGGREARTRPLPRRQGPPQDHSSPLDQTRENIIPGDVRRVGDETTAGNGCSQLE
ncbi:hypothetical protein Tco_0303551 [Tanacetum coccineum]|uniref:Uncharacterized protein n=1 Tax=Tanacetum coccineum TaxID=301880 RepID=A0ABQ4ZPJ1_9ASTR